MEQPIAESQFTLTDLLWISVLMPPETPVYLLIAWCPSPAVSAGARRALRIAMRSPASR